MVWKLFDRRPRLILHVGTHKTGTTSIQKVLHDHRDHDRARGLYYPLPPPAWSSSRTPHHELAHRLASTAPDAVAKAERFREHILTTARRRERIVISAEPLYRHVMGMDWTSPAWPDPKKYWPARTAFLQHLGRWLTPFNVSVLIFIRERRDFAMSLAAEQARRKVWDVDPQALMASHSPQLFDYDRQIALLSKHVGPVSVVDYDAALVRGGSVVAFYAALGLQPPPGSADVRVRVTNELDAPVAATSGDSPSAT